MKQDKTMARLRKITPCLWFDHQAEEAAHFYVSIFRDARICEISRYGNGSKSMAVPKAR